MAIDSRQGGKVIKNVRKEDTPGTRVDPYPYLGIVKNNLDPIRAGRIQVWIPDFGGDSEEPKNWRTVSYASPYMGTTNIPLDGSKTNAWTESPHTYGMWMTPPDIGVEVLVMFLGGDPLKGYWFACVNSRISRHMLPAIGSNQYPDSSNSSEEVKKTYAAACALMGDRVPAPVTEFNSNLQDYATNPAFVNIPKPIHEEQYKILVQQGLDRDKVRGTSTSSSQRETPSNVFGISTPGRPVNDPADDPTFLDKVAAGTLKESDYAVKTRKGGHTFVMDDGDNQGKNRLVRLRSSSGHQILLNDSDNTLYIANNKGTVWLEFTEEGRLNFYSQNGIDIRTGGEMNFHADGSIRFNTAGTFQVKSEGKTHIDCSSFNLVAGGAIKVGSGAATQFKAGSGFHVDTGSKISLKAGGNIVHEGSIIKQNSGGAVSVSPVPTIPVLQLGDTLFDETKGLWVQNPGVLRTIVTLAPTHEPSFRRVTPTTKTPPQPPNPAAAVPTSAAGPQDSNAAPSTSTTSTAKPGTFTGATGTPVTNPVTADDIRKQPLSTSTVGNLSKEQVTSLFAQVGKQATSVSSGLSSLSLPSLTSTTGTSTGLGKYLLGFSALISAGLVKSSVTSDSQLAIDSNWLQNVCGSMTEFKTNTALQEETMLEYTKKNYNLLCANGVINDLNKTKPEEVAGWLSVAHVLGANGAYQYAKNGTNSAIAAQLFQQGKFSSTLASQVSTILAG